MNFDHNRRTHEFTLKSYLTKFSNVVCVFVAYVCVNICDYHLIQTSIEEGCMTLLMYWRAWRWYPNRRLRMNTNGMGEITWYKL